MILVVAGRLDMLRVPTRLFAIMSSQFPTDRTLQLFISRLYSRKTLNSSHLSQRQLAWILYGAIVFYCLEDAR